MRKIEINETLDFPINKTWELFVNLENYHKYFKYTIKVFYKEPMSLGSVWFDFATFVFPLIVKHKVTVFEKEKDLGFDVYIPLKGYIKERINFKSKGNSTLLGGSIVFDFGNPLFSFLFDNLFEKRMRESISEALVKFKKEISK